MRQSFWLPRRDLDTGEFFRIDAQLPELRLVVYSEWAKTDEVSKTDPWAPLWFSTESVS